MGEMKETVFVSGNQSSTSFSTATVLPMSKCFANDGIQIQHWRKESPLQLQIKIMIHSPAPDERQGKIDRLATSKMIDSKRNNHEGSAFLHHL
jgi:hypothetical protein